VFWGYNELWDCAPTHRQQQKNTYSQTNIQ
jgi:hypothetical protein